jgi:hypothetical protein
MVRILQKVNKTVTPVEMPRLFILGVHNHGCRTDLPALQQAPLERIYD